ncbi:3-dehydroquinate synthase [Hydrogenovibrio sp. SC-1]|nr:3-dehydroquinate synthase [Hydrogenovibrio sp. SC-1]
MEGLSVNELKIFSDSATYDLFFSSNWDEIRTDIDRCAAVIIDDKVFGLYGEILNIQDKKIIKIKVSEDIKTPQTALDICEEMVLAGVTRDAFIVAIGGGVVQDLVTFAASIYMRGIDWVLYPTTLLSQADSCIGGKSSINFKSWKNILGNFYTPKRIYIQSQFLETLTDDDIRSGIGEILKVFMLSGQESLERLIEQMNCYQNDSRVLESLIFESLKLKNNILEVDALDNGLRLKMNYGHSFGHALEAATHFGIPHGIAVTIGLDVANYFALKQGLIEHHLFDRLHSTLTLNLIDSDFVDFNFNEFIRALEKDKKNKQGFYGLIVPVSQGEVELKFFEMNQINNSMIREYFTKYYSANVE